MTVLEWHENMIIYSNYLSSEIVVSNLLHYHCVWEALYFFINILFIAYHSKTYIFFSAYHLINKIICYLYVLTRTIDYLFINEICILKIFLFIFLGVGKSSLLLRFADNTFSGNQRFLLFINNLHLAMSNYF